ncbi:hypothetical protein BCR44DRAFT_1104636 [Catenaria anguillulae PL171]|uniref:Uncharacterized protein n=1 Tax=Catenaria anguillulae PL171 TaxID=765915 RepID=A0A1Y2I2U4_9FUNG|nr:hypothetical protein BCR44DRAFT_1104636 [Catenaria anguillulae PL171]
MCTRTKRGSALFPPRVATSTMSCGFRWSPLVWAMDHLIKPVRRSAPCLGSGFAHSPCSCLVHNCQHPGRHVRLWLDWCRRHSPDQVALHWLFSQHQRLAHLGCLVRLARRATRNHIFHCIQSIDLVSRAN